MFDPNDFDEAAWAPWEWDLKRLIASIVVAGLATSRDESATTDAARSAVRAYASAMSASIALSPTARYFSHLDAETGIGRMDAASRKVLQTAIRDARKRTGERAARKLTTAGPGGRLVFVENPPTMMHGEPEIERRVHEFIGRYAASAQADVHQLIGAYTVADVARRVVGVGGVGTRCALVLLQDGDGNALVMQSKEAGASVLEQYGGIEQPRGLGDHVAAHGQGGRVVALQRMLQRHVGSLARLPPLRGHRSARAAVPRHEGRDRCGDARGRPVLDLRAGMRGHSRTRTRPVGAGRGDHRLRRQRTRAR